MSERGTYLYRGTPGGFPRNGTVCASQEAISSKVAPLDDGWTWPLQVMEAGWADASIEGAPHGTPQYVLTEAVAQVAEACKSARFGRRHPSGPQEESDPTRIAGMITEGHMEGDRAIGTLRLNTSETQIRAQLMGAKKAGCLDLFGVSVCGLFEMEAKNIQGAIALEVQKLARLISIDLVLDAGAGGKILPCAGYRAAASEYLPPELATIREIENSLVRMAADQIYLAAIQCTLGTAEAILSDLRNERSRTTL